MKLLLITAVAEFGKEVKQILKNANVKTYSYKEVVGYRNASEDALGSNWFGTEMNETNRLCFMHLYKKRMLIVYVRRFLNLTLNKKRCHIFIRLF